MRSKLASTLALSMIAAAPSAPRAEGTDVTTTLMRGGDPLIFSGKVTYGDADRYFFVASKGARVTARLTATHSALVLVVVPADADPRRERDGLTFATAADVRLEAAGRHAVFVLFNPRLRFAAAPPPASYRLELRME